MKIGIDLGGTKIESILLRDDGEIIHRLRTATPRGEYASILQAIAEHVAQQDTVANQSCPVGMGIPGSISPTTGLLRNANTTELNGQTLQADLTKLIHKPVRIENDANCFALSEAIDGSGKGHHCVFGVIVGTGTGAGISIGQQTILGRNGVGGEWGHNPLPWPRADEIPGPSCYCGKQGCIETYLSGPGFESTYQLASGKKLTSAAIVDLAQHGDQQAQACVDTYIDRMARALASVINILDPDVIVLGGGMSNIDLLYDAVPNKLKDYVFSDAVTTPIVKPTYGDSSGVRGAAWLNSN